jgi:3-methyladenine DNA glycosylase AlkD
MITSDDVVTALDQACSEQGAPDDTGPAGQPAPLRMRDLFAVAKAHRDLPCDEVEALLEHPGHQARLAAVCILDFKARRARSRDERHPLYALYLRRHDRIDTWDMVDRAAPWVVGGYLTGHDLAPLVELAASSAPLERRTAMTAPLYFVKAGTDADLIGAFDIADRLVNDPIPVVHNAVGIFIKHAGRRDPARQRAFLDRHAAAMPRPGLRLAILGLEPDERRRYLALRHT